MLVERTVLLLNVLAQDRDRRAAGGCREVALNGFFGAQRRSTVAFPIEGRSGERTKATMERVNDGLSAALAL